MTHLDIPKICCIYCSKELYIRYHNKHLKSCRMKDKKIGIDFVICPICGKRVKEINNVHLKSHNLTVKEFDRLYSNYERLSEKSRNKKATFIGKTHSDDYKLYMSKIMMGVNKGKTLTDRHKKRISKSIKKIWKERYDKLCYIKTYDYYIEKWGRK